MPSSGRQYWPPGRRHALEALRAAAAGEAEQHGLGLVVEGVAEQQRDGAELAARLGERCVARRAGGGLGAAVLRPTIRVTDEHRVEAEVGGLAGGALRGIRDPSCRPWSTITAPARSPARGASKAVAAASARESGPPERATSTSESDLASVASALAHRPRARRRWPG